MYWLEALVGLLVILSVHSAPRDCRYGKQCVFPCHCDDSTTCNKETGECQSGSCDQTYMGAAWKGAACQVGNIAYGKKTEQSGTNGEHTSDLAVDGYLASNATERNCARILNDNVSPAQWVVNFGHPCLVENILIYSTFDVVGASTLTDISFIVKNETGDDHVCYDFTGTAPMGYRATLSINCIPPVVGSQVVLRRFGKALVDQMTLCEVMVTGHRYVDCSLCPGQCDSIRGCHTCPPGTRIPDCSQPCVEGFYGTNCQEYCENCRLGTTCRATDGYCTAGCRSGWFGNRCHIQHGSVGETIPGHTGITGYPSYTSPPRWQATGPLVHLSTIIINPAVGLPYPTDSASKTDVNSSSTLSWSWLCVVSLFLINLFPNFNYLF